MNLAKTLVIGNSGSGKSWLSEQLAESLGCAWLDLDLLHWEPGGYNVARKREDVLALAREAASADFWIIEGIYGWIVSELLSTATALIWVRIDESECVANIEQRGIRRGACAQSFAELLQWAKSYRARSGSSSYAAHDAIFRSFARAKHCLQTRDEVTAFAGVGQLRAD
ncbi:adenylate kinase [Paraburkholderia fynbosensis]|uniref:Adenylate kinase n=1 Tax=Paraburkholderia fynbosensis TaxID=1200993 RepID=A0A6J5GV23_9BURK|nr:adenylate kinase [Paraburkholderia fynbosensis]CAB3806700.1 hypothetical protein LMG27177_06161 [Paraburkholderia fynbosensis]